MKKNCKSQQQTYSTYVCICAFTYRKTFVFILFQYDGAEGEDSESDLCWRDSSSHTMNKGFRVLIQCAVAGKYICPPHNA